MVDASPMGAEHGTAVPIYVDGLDATMAKSVRAFLESRHREHFDVVTRDLATVLLVDLDQPGATGEVAAARAEQIIMGIGFAPEPTIGDCRRYVQKPLTGAALVDALDEVVTLVGARSGPATARVRVERPSHARDVFTRGRAYDPPPPKAPRRAPTWDADVPARRHSRNIHATTPRMVDVADDRGSAASAAESLGRQVEVEPIEPSDVGDLFDLMALTPYRYPADQHLDGRLREAHAAHPGVPWELHSSYLSFVNDPATDAIYVSASDTRLRRVCAGPLQDEWRLTVHRRTPDLSRHRPVPHEVLLWNTAVWCSHGRLPHALDPFSPVSVTAWPDLTRGVVTPCTLPIVALLAASPHRPVDLPDKLGISRTHVFVVLAALHAVGRLEGLGGSWQADPERVAPTVERGVLRRLLGRLRDQ